MTAIDLFAGLGGFSTGAKLAGVSVAWAANHWPVAVEWHSRNHPDVQHKCQDLHQCDWTQVPSHDLLLASPACQGHSSWFASCRPCRRHDAEDRAELTRLQATLAPHGVLQFRGFNLRPAAQLGAIDQIPIDALHALSAEVSALTREVREELRVEDIGFEGRDVLGEIFGSELHDGNIFPETSGLVNGIFQKFVECANSGISDSPKGQNRTTIARGADRPHHDATRSTAWAVVSCVEVHRPPVVVVENVPEFLSWVLWPTWKSAMEALGYALAHEVIDAADVGVPQHRRRLFIIATRSKSPLAIRPEPVPHTPIASVIDWEAGSWSRILRPGRSRKTLRRLAAGRAEFGDRFVAPYYGSGSGLTGRSIDRPLGTVTTRDRWAVVDGSRMRMLSIDEYRGAMGFPVGTALPTTRAAAIHLLGNAVCPPVASAIIEQIQVRA